MNIKNLIWKLKNKINNLEVVTTGINNTDKYVKKFCLEFNVKYGEILPYYKKWNNYCIKESFLYDKEYSPKWFFVNNKNFVEYCDAFVFLGNISDKADFNIIKEMKKSEKIIKNIL